MIVTEFATCVRLMHEPSGKSIPTYLVGEDSRLPTAPVYQANLLRYPKKRRPSRSTHQIWYIKSNPLCFLLFYTMSTLTRGEIMTLVYEPVIVYRKAHAYCRSGRRQRWYSGIGDPRWGNCYGKASRWEARRGDSDFVWWGQGLG